jgi:hypothetical protein
VCVRRQPRCGDDFAYARHAGVRGGPLRRRHRLHAGLRTRLRAAERGGGFGVSLSLSPSPPLARLALAGGAAASGDSFSAASQFGGALRRRGHARRRRVLRQVRENMLTVW